jgi:signal transduction histidine kinase
MESKLRANARHYIQHFVVRRCQDALQEGADAAIRAAFEEKDAGWRSRPEATGDGLFVDAFFVSGARIREATGALLWAPRDVAEAESRAARARARELGGPGDWDAAQKARLDLEFAERYPFSLDVFGESLALLFAATPLFGGDGAPDGATLLRIRWVGVLNSVARIADAREVSNYLARVEEAGAASTSFAEGVKDQDRRAGLLGALVRERPSLSPSRAPGLHRNVRAPRESAFYLRGAGRGELQVLAVDRARLRKVLHEVVRDSRPSARSAFDGIVPRIEEGFASSFFPDPAHDIPGIPGHAVVAHITSEAVQLRTSGRARFYWWIIAFSVAGILAGGLLTARAVMREVKLAKLKSGFVSNVTHELKTPLTSIRMFAEMLRSGKVTDEQETEECLGVIAHETERLTNLIQKVLDFGRLEARQRRFHWVAGPLAPVLEREAERFRRATGLSEEHFRVRIAEGLPPVTYDPDAMGDVIANLLSNAYKYAPTDDRQIELALEPGPGRVLLSVDDNGPGIRPRERKRVFEQFYRAGDLLSQGVEGSGLGLSIALSIVRAHSGRIAVTDGKLGGSRFVVTLPAGIRGRPVAVGTIAETTS